MSVQKPRQRDGYGTRKLCREVKTAIVSIIVAALTSIIAVGACWYFLYHEWQPVRATLETVLLGERVDFEHMTLREAAQALVSQVQSKKQVKLRCVFSPETLANRMPITSTLLDGNAYYAIHSLEYSYDCSAEFAGDHIILFTDESPRPPTER